MDWVINQSKPIAKMRKRHLRRLNKKMLKYDKQLSPSEITAPPPVSPAPTSLVAVATLHMAQEQVNRIICELQAAVGKPYGVSALFCR